MRAPLAVVLAGALLVVSGTAGAAESRNMLRELLRQQAAASREVCPGVRRGLAAEPNAAIVVRTAIELGYNSCQVIRCALEGGADLPRVLQGAGEAGVTADVAARCALEAGVDGRLVARALTDLAFEPTFCYYSFGPPGIPERLAPLPPIVERTYPGRPQASVFTF